jgi:two-component system, cell cycle response regulator
MDRLTGLTTRQDLLSRFDRMIAEGIEPDHPVSLTLANLDHFKAINLEYGHLVGDEIVEELTALLIQRSAVEVVIARIGGDLFTFLERTGLEDAKERADALRREISRVSFSKGIHLTASFGVATATSPVPFGNLLQDAEACLYAAKAKGRDCVVDSAEFATMVGHSPHDAEIVDNENKLRVLTDRLGRAVQLRSRGIAGRLNVEIDRDGLTGLYNRRYLDRRLAREIEAAHKRSRGFTLSLLDLDHFGNINRTYGYPAGDTALQAMAEILQENIRSTDWVARYGGEEFCLVLPDTPIEEAVPVAERIRAALALRVMRSHDGREFGITVSQGLVQFGPRDRCGADLIQRAGEKLREAKNGGRNRVSWEQPWRGNAARVPAAS